MNMQEVVKNLFAKAASTHSEHEAEQAILKAHELMAKYGITAADEEVQYIRETCKHPGNKGFRRILANVIAPNFKVKYFLSNMKVTFFEQESDVHIAKEVYEYAYSFANRRSRQICAEMKANHFDITGLANSYTLGFCNGLKEKLDSQSTSLMVIVPPDVDSAYKELSKNFKHSKFNMNTKGHSSSIYNHGVQDGRNVLNGRQLESNNGD